MALINPVPSSGWDNNGGYDSDSGLDIIVPVGTKCVSAADGIIEYAERGHTPWFEDTNLSTALLNLRIASESGLTIQSKLMARPIPSFGTHIYSR